MISSIEMRRISLEFRRKSSDMLNATYENANVQMQRFKTYIDTTDFIRDIIQRKIAGVDFDYKQCFVGDSLTGWKKIQIPVDEACHIKAMYDYMDHIIESGESLIQIALAYSQQTKITEAIREFFCEAFKPLIDFVVDEISKEMIVLEETKSPDVSFVQNIGTVYGSANQQQQGNITANTYNYQEVEELSRFISEFIRVFDTIETDDPESLLDIRDDLETISEQVSSEMPKKRRIERALDNIKTFALQVSTQLAVSTTSGAIAGLEWSELIDKVNMFIEML